MFACEACGGALRFDVASQKMLCPFCDSSYDPYKITDQGNAEEQEDYDVTIFTCPQCGGELGSVETSAAEFCSYCGAPTILESRLSRMKKPKYIIPFQKTKEESKEALRKSLGRAFFVSKDLKNAEIEKIRGIYMPYWNYNVKQEGVAEFRMTEDDGDYEVSYHLEAKVDAHYQGIPHDASVAFADRMSEELEPYSYKERKPFAPAFLAGFYSDIQDVDSSKYEKEAVEMADQKTYQEFLTKANVSDIAIRSKDKKRLSEIFSSQLEEPDHTLVPVWFLSLRKGKRVAYAAINGESGKVVSDMPMDIKKIWGAALLLAIPIFLLLNLFVSMRASTSLYLANIMTAVTSAIYLLALIFIDDKLDYEKTQFERALKESSKKKTEEEPKEKKPFTYRTILKAIGYLGCFLLLLIPALIILFIVGSLAAVGIAMALVAISFVCSGLAVVIPLFGIYIYHKNRDQVIHRNRTFLLLLLVAMISIAILLWDPVSDVIFYSAVIADLLVILYSLSDVIKAMNIIYTRPLPQFVQRGASCIV